MFSIKFNFFLIFFCNQISSLCSWKQLSTKCSFFSQIKQFKWFSCFCLTFRKIWILFLKMNRRFSRRLNVFASVFVLASAIVERKKFSRENFLINRVLFLLFFLISSWRILFKRLFILRKCFFKAFKIMKNSLIVIVSRNLNVNLFFKQFILICSK